jgi:hypothetical protein
MNENENTTDAKAMPPASTGSVSAIVQADEIITRQRAEIAALRSRPCPYVTGKTTHYCTLPPFTLTSDEQSAIEWFAGVRSDRPAGARQVLFSLLERYRAAE